ncbi:MAG: hypothetical protein RLZZ584_746 [Pseudomonadota bacterium]
MPHPKFTPARPARGARAVPQPARPLGALAALLLAGAALWPLQPARAEDGHGAPHGDAHAAKPAPAKEAAAPKEAPAKDRGATTHADATAPAGRPAARPAASGAAITMDELSQKHSDKVAAVRERQARSPATPTLRLAARSPSGTGRGAAAKVANLGASDAHDHAAHDIHWAYNGDGGPARWGELKPEFATCSNGQRQSPIDIRGGLRVDLDPIRFDYHAVPFGVIDNGHTIQANLQPGSGLEVAGRRYELLQFHFHRPSEERINGHQYDMVVHLVHRSADGRLAVVAVLIEQGRSHPLVQLVWNSLPLERNEEQGSPVPIDLNQLLPDDRRYYTYMGSLTTPPCSEGVLWMVLKHPATFSPEQIAVFARMYPMNARPIQQASGRLIKESN